MNLPLQFAGVSKFRQYSMVMSSEQLRPKSVLVNTSNNHKLQTHPFIREGDLIEKTADVKIMSKEVKEKLVAGARWRPNTRTDWPTVSHKITLTIFTSSVPCVEVG
jgi:hypothetical protein